LTNSATSNLDSDLALGILYDFISDPNRVYYNRLMALPVSKPVIQGDALFRPPIGLAQMIEELAMPPTAQDPIRWKKYIGLYGAKAWGVIDPSQAFLEVHQLGSHLYAYPIDTAKDLRLTEVSPGLFFAENGQALDFRAAVPTWRNIKVTKVSAGPAFWQQAILVACGLIFLSGVVWLPLRAVTRRLRRAAPARIAMNRWARLASPLDILAGLFGIASIVLVFAYPKIVYSGFLGWLELPLWQRLIMHAPFALLIASLGLFGLIMQAWVGKWWSRIERIYFLVFGLASIAVLLLFSHWHLIGLSLG
jgi:hypothetical protein